MKLPGVLRGEGDSLKTGILAAAGLCVVAGGLLVWQWSTFRKYSAAIPIARRTLESIVVASGQIKALEDELREDPFVHTQDQSYITQQAIRARMGDVNPKKRLNTPSKGYQDTIFDVTASTKDQRFMRQQLATFFWYIENETSRMRVTKIDIHSVDKKKVEDDLWLFSSEFVSRSRDEGK